MQELKWLCQVCECLVCFVIFALSVQLYKGITAMGASISTESVMAVIMQGLVILVQ